MNTVDLPPNKHTILSFALGTPGMQNARQNLETIRFDKTDKESVVIVSAQKAGSTLLCYISALINTKNRIKDFRNDFDILPMLSFPNHLIAQNFNARQDGEYQMYKINGSFRRIHQSLHGLEKQPRIIWSGRDFQKYFASVYWWLREFYPRIGYHNFKNLDWSTFQDIAFEQMAKDYVEELWFVFKWAEQDEFQNLLPLFHENTVYRKRETIAVVSDWLQVPLSAQDSKSIEEKTSKESMGLGNRFDPVTFGEGLGLSKVNIAPHPFRFSPEYESLFQEIFSERFSGTSVRTYAELRETTWGKVHHWAP